MRLQYNVRYDEQVIQVREARGVTLHARVHWAIVT